MHGWSCPDPSGRHVTQGAEGEGRSALFAALSHATGVGLRAGELRGAQHGHGRGRAWRSQPQRTHRRQLVTGQGTSRDVLQASAIALAGRRQPGYCAAPAAGAGGGRMSRNAAAPPRTLFDKLWDAHLVAAEREGCTGGAVHRPAPGARSDLAAGLRRTGGARPAGAPPSAPSALDHSTPTLPPMPTAACPTPRRMPRRRSRKLREKRRSSASNFRLRQRPARHRA